MEERQAKAVINKTMEKMLCCPIQMCIRAELVLLLRSDKKGLA